MNESDTLVRAFLEGQVPLRLEFHPDWDGVLRQARPRLVSRPRVLVPALVLLGLVIAGVALAAAPSLRWWESAPPPVEPGMVAIAVGKGPTGSVAPGADLDKARTVARARGRAALVALPLGKDGYCLVPLIIGQPDLGTPCEYQATDWLGTYASPESEFGRWIVYGRIVDPRAAVLDLGNGFRVPLEHGGFFIANVPTTLRARLIGRAGRGRILDASGATIATGCVNWGPGTHAGQAVKYGFWLAPAGRCEPRPVTIGPPKIKFASGAEKLVEWTLTRTEGIYPAGSTIALWRIPTQNGWVCIRDALANEPPTGPNGRNPAGAGACGPAADQMPPGTKIRVSFSATLQGTVYVRLIDGQVDPNSGITRLELRDGSGTLPIAYQHHWFMAELPNSNSADKLDGGPYVLVGYDADGNEVARVDLAEQLSADEPPPR